MNIWSVHTSNPLDVYVWTDTIGDFDMNKYDKPYLMKSIYLNDELIGYMEIYWLTNAVHFRFTEDKYMLNLFENLEFEFSDFGEK